MSLRTKKGDVIFHMWEKSATSFFRHGLLPLLDYLSPRHIHFLRNYTVDFNYYDYDPEVLGYTKTRIVEDQAVNRYRGDFKLNGFHIILLRDFRDMLVSNYWNTWVHPGCEAISNQKKIIKKCNSISDYAKFKRESVVETGYGVDFFNRVLLKEYDGLLKYIEVNGMKNVQFTYYEDLVTDFYQYLLGIQPIVKITNQQLSRIFKILKDSFKPDGGHKRRVLPGAYKEELDKDLSEYFAYFYKKYFFLHRYI